MIEFEEVDRLAQGAIEIALQDIPVQRVTSEFMPDAYGDDGIRLRVVVPDEAVGRLDPYRYREARASVKRILAAAGDTRWPVLAFATESEMARDDASES